MRYCPRSVMRSLAGSGALARGFALSYSLLAPALSAEPPLEGESAPRVLLLLPANAAADRQDLASAAERLRELSVEVASRLEDTRLLARAREHARRATRQEKVLGVLWLGTWRAERTLFVHEPRTDHTLGRRLPRSGNPSADREELAIVVRGTVTALLEGHAPDMEPLHVGERTEESGGPGARLLRVAPPLRPAEPDVVWALRAGYVGMTPLLEADGGWDSGASLGLRAWLPLGLHADIAYGFLPATSVSLPSASASFSRHPLSLAFGASIREPSRLFRWMGAELVLGVDRVTRSTAFTSPELEPTDGEGRWLFGGGARLGGAAAVTEALSLYALFGGEAALNRVDYVVDEGDALRRSAVAPFAIKAELGVAIELTSRAPRRAE